VMKTLRPSNPMRRNGRSYYKTTFTTSELAESVPLSLRPDRHPLDPMDTLGAFRVVVANYL